MDHLEELDHTEEDEDILSQGSHFRDRVFLSEIVERKLDCSIVTQDITVAEFLLSPGIKMQNAFPDPGNASLGLLTKKIYQQKFFSDQILLSDLNFFPTKKFFEEKKF